MTIDHRVETFVVHHRTEPFDSLFVFLSRIGSYGLVWILIAAVVAFTSRRPSILPLVVIAYAIGDS